MPFVYIVLIWLVLCLVLGVIGTAVGPGIIMALSAMFLALWGAIVEITQFARRQFLNPFWSALLVVVLTSVSGMLFVTMTRTGLGGVIFYLIYFLLLALVGTFLTRRLVRVRSS